MPDPRYVSLLRFTSENGWRSGAKQDGARFSRCSRRWTHGRGGHQGRRLRPVGLQPVFGIGVRFKKSTDNSINFAR